MKVAICIPSQDYLHIDFMMSVLVMQRAITVTPPTPEDKEVDYNIFIRRSSLLIGSRTELAKDALDWGADWILWLDSDMKFPAGTIHHLFKSGKNLVGANYVKRQLPTTPVSVDYDKKFIRTDPDSTGLVKAASGGFGVLLVKADLFRNTPLPWFDTVWLEDGSLMGEDVFFFTRVKHYTGEDLWIDHDLSQQVIHVGSFDYHNRLAQATIDEMEKLNNVQDTGSSLQ